MKRRLWAGEARCCEPNLTLSSRIYGTTVYTATPSGLVESFGATASALMIRVELTLMGLLMLNTAEDRLGVEPSVV